MNLLIDPSARPVIGHRGMAAAAPENTIEAMRLAFAYGADAIEFDIRLSADGEVVVIHDPAVDRTTDGTGEVSKKSLSELRELNAAARFAPGRVEDRPAPPAHDALGVPYPEYISPRPRETRAGIPLLREVLEEFPERNLLIEIKDPRASEPARRIIEAHGAQGRCMVDSYHDSALEKFRLSGIAVGAGRKGVIERLKSSLLLRQTATKYEGMCIPTEFRGFPLPIALLARTAAREAKTVHIWTINSPALAARLWRKGVNGIVTDDVRPILRERRLK